MMKITEVLGVPPVAMLEKGQKTKRYFVKSEVPDAPQPYERIKTEKVRHHSHFVCFLISGRNTSRLVRDGYKTEKVRHHSHFT
jgi:hypothetical protein